MDQPTTFRAGDSIAWTIELAGYPASAGWSLKYRLLDAGGNFHDIFTAADGDGFTVSLTSAATKDWVAGKATLVAIVEKDAQRKTIGAPIVTVLPNLTEVTTFDGRSRNEKALDDAEAALADYLAGGKMHVEEYEIDGNRMKFRDVDSILKLISSLRLAVAKERGLKALLAGAPVSRRICYRG